MPGAFSFLFQQVGLIAAGEAQDAQQADEDVVQRHVQAHGGADIVRLTAANDVAGFKQDRAGRDQNKYGADRQVQSRQLQEDVGHHTHQHHHNTRHQHAAEEGHILTRGQHVGRAAEEHQRGTAQRHTNHIAHSGGQIRVQDWPQDVAQEAGEGKRGQNTDRFVSGFVGQEHQAIHAHQGQNQPRRRQHQQGAGGGGDRRKRQRQAEHEIGIAQHLVGAE